MACTELEWVEYGVGDERIRQKCLAAKRVNGAHKGIGFKPYSS